MLNHIYSLGNLYKWLFAPRGCAILWVSPKFNDIIVPQVVSFCHDKSLQDRFFLQGTIDHTPYTSAATALKFYQEIGGMVSVCCMYFIMQYITLVLLFSNLSMTVIN